MKKILSKIWKHKYLWALMAFVIIVGFLDPNSYWNRFKMIRENDSLRNEISRYEEKCHQDSLRLEQLRRDHDAVIHVAREVYFMKRPHEDVYIIAEEDASSPQS